MLDKKVAELINTQVNKEFYSAYLYLDFAMYAIVLSIIGERLFQLVPGPGPGGT